MNAANTKESKIKFKTRLDDIGKQLQLPEDDATKIRNEIIKFLDTHKINYEEMDDKEIYILTILVINYVMDFMKFNMTLEGIITLLNLSKPAKLITDIHNIEEPKPEVIEIFGKATQSLLNKNLIVFGKTKNNGMLVILNTTLAQKELETKKQTKVSEL